MIKSPSSWLMFISGHCCERLGAAPKVSVKDPPGSPVSARMPEESGHIWATPCVDEVRGEPYG